MKQLPAQLVLKDGTVFHGISIGAPGSVVGELVFNTAMTGYQEILTDPSYAKQIVVLTSPHVGNTGCNLEDMESTRAWASGLIVRNCTHKVTHFRSTCSLPHWLRKYNIVAIEGIDTRALTLHLRRFGSMDACITTDINNLDKALADAQEFPGLKGMMLTQIVSRKTEETWLHGRGSWGTNAKPQSFHIVAYDFGVKHTSLRILYDLGCHITLVPYDTTAEEIFRLNPDGVFLANGPGDPAACTKAIIAVKEILDKNLPLFGICLGFQILALACGAKSIKMPFGHHGANHPVVEIESQKQVFITSQNHGFAIDEKTLPECLIATHRSLFDSSLQGIKHRTKPAFALQGHPEASPGPHDMLFLFENFITLLKEYVT